MIELLQYPFMQRAFVAALLVGSVASFFSVFIVQRRMSFFGSGIAHASFGGVSLGLLLGWDAFWLAAPFTLLISILFVWLSKNSRLESDSIIGVLSSLAMALGIVFLSMRTTYSQDAMTLLFGSLLAVQASDLWWSSLLFSACLSFGWYWRRWAFATFDRELARLEKRATDFDDYLLAALISLTVVTAIKVFGIVLLSAFLVIPAASSRLIAQSFRQMTIGSISIGVSSSITGILFSYSFDIPTGAAVILVLSFVFALSFLYNRFYSPR
jgi:zinc transport system permease protein